ncbi:MAG: DNA primase, partial [Sulfuricurvum sp.]|nr:DNA primase [Sulfuricurvum sp.]
AIRAEPNNPRLNALMMNNSIRVFEGDTGVKKALLTFLENHYTRELKKINTQNTISFDQKSYLIRQLRDKIARLKKGELVPLG